MGLLDDAIREHMELKRRGGADPGQVAREQQDALGPVRGDDHVAQGDDPSEVEVPEMDRSFFAEGEFASVEPSTVGQETVEINMEAELSGATDSESAPGMSRPGRSASVAHSAHTQGGGEDSLEWEVPSEVAHDAAAPGGDGDIKAEGDSENGEHVEDVLEETPDFLRDTPEQERLWFEQRPPRDFDFNE